MGRFPAVDAIVVLGCAVRDGRPSPALDRRIELAVRAYREGVAPRIVASGGCSWHGHVEARVIASELQRRVLGAELILEDDSRNTVENALFTRQRLEPLGWRRVLLATSPWHLNRALANFRQAGLEAVPPPRSWLDGPPPSLGRRIREVVSGWLDAERLARLLETERREASSAARR